MTAWIDVVSAIKRTYDLETETDDEVSVMLEFPSGARQPVHVFPVDRGDEPDLLLLVSPVCSFTSESAAAALAASESTPFGVRVIGNDVVLQQTSYLATVDTSTIAGLINEVAWFADQVERATTGQDAHAQHQSTCPSCGAERSEGARFCGDCGSAFDSASAGSAGGPATGDGGMDVIGPGTWIVGSEIAPGTYRVAGYWARLDSRQGIIANDSVMGSGLSLMEVRASDAYVEISGEAVELSQMPSVDPMASDMRAGTYLVGVDVAPGRYRVSGEGSLAYAARLDRNLGIIQNEANQGSVLIHVTPSDFALQFSGLLTQV